MTIDQERADKIAREVFAAACDALSDNAKDGLPAFAYAERALEVWLVLEAYKRIFPKLEDTNSALAGPGGDVKWSAWPEVLLPGQEKARQHIDLFVGPHKTFPGKDPGDDYYDTPCDDAPVFEFKFIRWDNTSDGLSSVAADVEKITAETTGLRHGYSLLLYLMEKPDDIPRDAAIARDDRLEKMAPECFREWGGTTIPNTARFCFRLEMLRMKRPD
jgi:hypothetical protein